MKNDQMLVRSLLLKELIRLSGDTVLREDLAIEPLPETLEQMQAEEERELASELIEEHTRTLHAVQSALEKMQAGAYGRCERCEEPIPGERLRAIPWAPYCVDCQQLVEITNQATLRADPTAYAQEHLIELQEGVF